MRLGAAARGLLIAALVASLLAVKGALRELRLAAAGPGRAVSTVFTPGEQIAASLLGGFRAVLLNVLWIRIQSSIERKQHLELPYLLDAVEDLQGISPELYVVKSRMMCLDLPRHFARDGEERWRWIVRGLGVLDRGLRRFPQSTRLLEEAGFIYSVRFDPRASPADRERYREEFPERTDPIDAAAGILERAMEREDHGIKVDLALLRVDAQRLSVALDAEVERLLEAETRRRVEARLRDPSIRAGVEAVLARTLGHLEHIERAHVAGIEDQRVRTELAALVRLHRDEMDALRRTFLEPAADGGR